GERGGEGMGGSGWMGGDEGGGGGGGGGVAFGQLLGGSRRREHDGKEEESERDAESGAEHAAEQEEHKAAPEPLHQSSSRCGRRKGPQSAVGRRRMVNSMRPSGSSRQDSISVM